MMYRVYDLIFKQMGRALVFVSFLVFLNSSGNAQGLFRGRVLDSISGEPVSFAHVIVSRTNLGTVADEWGRFTLRILDGQSNNIRISSIGYETKTIQRLDQDGTYVLQPKPVILDSVMVFAPTEEARKIVKRAFQNISKNYFKEPIVLDAFYRHYCLDNGKYGRMIEAQIDVYKNKGYGRQEDFSKTKDRFRVNQLRRSYDQTMLNMLMHRPMALDIALKSDIVALRQRGDKELQVLSSVLDAEGFVGFKKNREFEYTLKGMVQLDSGYYYQIAFEYIGSGQSKGIHQFRYSGEYLISETDYAIVKFSSDVRSLSKSIKQVTEYKRFGERYALFYTRSLLWNKNNNDDEHLVDIEFIVENLRREKVRDIDRKEISRSYLASVPYDSLFWSNYLFNKADVQPEIVEDLELNESLSTQFSKKSEYEKHFALSVEDGERKIDSILMNSEKPVVIYLWAAWNRKSMNDYQRNREGFSELKDKYQFIAVSLDENAEQWTIMSNAMGFGFPSIRIGPNSKLFGKRKIRALPTILLYKPDEVDERTFSQIDDLDLLFDDAVINK